LQQLKSEKHLFTLLATIIILVACSNIISMLIILVNDKKTEIGILRSMGATSSSIALIFGICGIVMGILGSLLGIICAIITLQNLQPLINLLSRLQGHDMFNPLFFGETLPTDLSFEALVFVVIATGFISLVAGLVPALKASLLRPSAILRSE
jgi:lipoprotein-releasing system permease protein